jgi:hypothetical protein
MTLNNWQQQVSSISVPLCVLLALNVDFLLFLLGLQAPRAAGHGRENAGGGSGVECAYRVAAATNEIGRGRPLLTGMGGVSRTPGAGKTNSSGNAER